MRTLKIKTFKMNITNTLPQHHFFILSKGNNAGKPLEKPCPNCFIVTANNLQEKGKLYWICYALWKSDIYFPLLCGSVIPFLHIKDVAAEIEKVIQIVEQDVVKFDNCVQQFQHLMRTEKLLTMQLELISRFKPSLAHKLVSTKGK